VLSRDHRLTSSGDFRRVYAQGESWSNPMLVLYKTPNGLDRSRFGFSVSRRIGSAVVRNRVKRLIREAVRLLCDMVSPGWDIVFIARKGIVGADYAQVEGAVRHLLRLAQLRRSIPAAGSDL
jgi:ribonuclease P protein component